MTNLAPANFSAEPANAPSRSVSVLIPTKNRTPDLVRTVESLLQQTVLPDELIIVDQSPADHARDLLLATLRHSGHGAAIRFRYLHEPKLTGLTEARNVSMRIASAEIWLFLDDDVIMEQDFLACILRTYDLYPEAAAVSGIITNYRHPTLGARLWMSVFTTGPFFDDRQPVYWHSDRLKDAAPIRVTRLGGGLMSFRASAVRHLQFDEALGGVADGEDVDFCQRLAGKTLLIAPSARLLHIQSPSGRLADHWVRRSARAMVFLYRKNWRHGLRNRLCYAWLLTGYSLVATFASLRKLSLAPWRALLAGIREGKLVVASPARPPAAPALPSGNAAE